MPGVINIRNRSVCHPYCPYSTRRSPCGIRDILDSSAPIMARKISTDIPGGCSEVVRTPLEGNRNARKPQGPIGMVRKEGHGYVISLRIYTDSHRGVYGQ